MTKKKFLRKYGRDSESLVNYWLSRAKSGHYWYLKSDNALFGGLTCVLKHV